MEWIVGAIVLYLLTSGRSSAPGSVPHPAPRDEGRVAKMPDPMADYATYRGSVDLPLADDASRQREAAYELAAYLARGGAAVGPIAHYQTHMGGIRADGIVGRETRARARDLGVSL
jgi:hypothetical protein